MGLKLKFNLKILIFTGKDASELASLIRKVCIYLAYQSMNKTAALKFPHLATSSKKKALKRITLNLTLDEAQNLEKYCEQTGKPAIDVIRELIEALP